MIAERRRVKARRRGGAGIVGLAALILALPVVVAALAAEEQTASQNPVQALPLKARLTLLKAQEKRDAGDFKESAKILYDFLAKNPRDDNYLVRYYLALSYSQGGEPEKAIDHYQACVAADSTFAPGWAKLAEAAYNLGSYRIASDAFMRSYAIDPRKQPELLYYGAAAYYLGGEPEKAIPVLEALVSGERGRPKLEWFRTLLAACQGAGEAEKGRAAASRMLDMFPDSPEAWRVAFQFYAGIRDYREAASMLTIKGYLEPLTREDARTLGDLYTAIGIPGQAASYYESSLSENAAAQDFERLASAYVSSYDFESADSTIARALEAAPSVRLYSLLGDLRLMEREYQKAYDAYSRCAEMDTTRGRPHLMMGYCAYELGQMDRAVAELERASRYGDSEKTAVDLLARIRPARR